MGLGNENGDGYFAGAVAEPHAGSGDQGWVHVHDDVFAGVLHDVSAAMHDDLQLVGLPSWPMLE